MVETRLFKYFLAVAREGNITKAAESVYVTQPTLSKQMMDLEDMLGKQLFVRGKNKITLTEYGEFFKSRAEEILTLVDSTEEAFKSTEDVTAGDIFIGCTESTGMKKVMNIAAEFRRKYPAVRIRVFSGDNDAILDRIDKGLLDVGIFFPSFLEKFEYTKLKLSEVFGLLMDNNCQFAAKEWIQTDDLKSIPLIIPDQLYKSKEVIEWFKTGLDSFTIAGTYSLIRNGALMVESGIGSAVCIGGLADTKNGNLVFRPFSPAVRVDTYLVTKKYAVLSPAVNKFVNRIKEELGV